MELKIHGGIPPNLPQASDKRISTSIPARDILSMVLPLYPCSDKQLPLQAGA